MTVITRNGKTTVYTGWRAWLIGTAALIIVWLVFVLVGIAITVGIMVLLLVPAAIVVAVVGGMVRR